VAMAPSSGITLPSVSLCAWGFVTVPCAEACRWLEAIALQRRGGPF
jgi:hypothetical protein